MSHEIVTHLKGSIAHSLQREKLELRDMNFLPCWLTQIAMCREEMQRNIGLHIFTISILNSDIFAEVSSNYTMASPKLCNYILNCNIKICSWTVFDTCLL